MSLGHPDKFLQKGGKCPTFIPTSFHKKEENFLESIMGDLNPRQIKSQEY